MWVKAEKHQKDGDDSAVNGIRLQCSDGKNLNSAEGAKGEWSQLFKYRTEGMYEEGYDPYKPYQNEIVSVYVRSMPPCTGNCDNEGVSGLRFKHLDGRYYPQVPPAFFKISDLAPDRGILQSELFTSRSQNLVLAKLPNSGFWRYGQFFK